MTYDDAMKIAKELLSMELKSQNISDIQRDICETAKEILAEPFDRNSAIKRILDNNAKNWDYVAGVNVSPNTCPVVQLSDDELIYNLQCQLLYLVTKMGSGQ